MRISASTHSIRKDSFMFVKIHPIFKFIKYVKDQLKPREILKSTPEAPVEEEDIGDIINNVGHSVNEALWLYSCHSNIAIYCRELTSLHNRLLRSEKIPLLNLVPINVQASEWFIADGVQKLPSELLAIFINKINLLETLVEVRKEELAIAPNFTHSRSIAACEFTLSNAKNILKELQSVRRPT